jgi:hypothetical protein
VDYFLEVFSTLGMQKFPYLKLGPFGNPIIPESPRNENRRGIGIPSCDFKKEISIQIPNLFLYEFFWHLLLPEKTEYNRNPSTTP